jgi:PAS domain S-box-containing protein
MPQSDSSRLPRLFASFMQNSPAHWWMKDGAGRYVFVNDSFAKFFHRDPDEFIGKKDVDFMSKPFAERVIANDQIVFDLNRSIHLHELLEGPDGERIFLTVKFPFIENGLRFVGGIGFDVTDARQAQLELQEARDKAAEAAALKSAFIASVKHEIRTPLAGITGMSELLLLTQLNDEQRYLAQTVQDSSEALLTVLNDILDMSKIESGRVGLAQVPFSVKFMVDESIRLMSAAAAHKGLKLTLEYDDRIPERLVGDPERLRQVLLNVLSNAVKFTSKGSVAASVRMLEQRDGITVVRFAISDTGIGIAEEKLPYVFMPFWQAETGDQRSYGGPGLGLPLSKHLVEKMGGAGIQIDTKPGVGSTFSFDLPFRAKLGKPDTALIADVLIIEDNPTLQAALITEFEALGIASESLDNLAAAAKQVEARQYKLVLAECILPDGDASGFVERLRLRETKQALPRTPVVVMSAAPSQNERERYITLGADDYVGKPLSTEQIWRLMNLWGMV